MNPYFEDSEEHLQKIRAEILRYQATMGMNDRERAQWLGLPEGCRIRENAKIIAAEKFQAGKYLWIGEGAMLDAQGGLSIGDYTQICSYALIWSHTSHLQALAGETCQSRGQIRYQATHIGKNCFIGAHTVIAPGVRIGNGVIVSPTSFVERDLEDGEIYNNNHHIKHLEDKIKALEAQVQNLEKTLEVFHKNKRL